MARCNSAVHLLVSYPRIAGEKTHSCTPANVAAFVARIHSAERRLSLDDYLRASLNMFRNCSGEMAGVAPVCVATQAANRFARSLISSSDSPRT